MALLKLFSLLYVFPQAWSICDLPIFSLQMSPQEVSSTSCPGPQDTYPARQSVSISSTSNYGYPNYDVYLTSGPSCSIDPSDPSFMYEAYWEVLQEPQVNLPVTSCGPNPPCCAVIQCQNTPTIKCLLSGISYSVSLPPVSPTPTATPVPSFTPSLSSTCTPTSSLGESPSQTTTPSPTLSSTPRPTPLPSATPLFSRSTCSYSDNFSLPATSQSNNYMFLSCTGARAESTPSMPYYASARMLNPNHCNISFVGSTTCAINPTTNYPAPTVGLRWTTAPSLSFSSLRCGTRSLSCCAMLWSDRGPCEDLSLSWSVQQRDLGLPTATSSPSPAPPAAATAATIVPGLSNAIFGGILGGVLALLCICAVIFFCSQKKVAKASSWDTVGSHNPSQTANTTTSNPLRRSDVYKSAAAGVAISSLQDSEGVGNVVGVALEGVEEVEEEEEMVEEEEESPSLLIRVCKFIVKVVIGVIKVAWRFLNML